MQRLVSARSAGAALATLLLAGWLTPALSTASAAEAGAAAPPVPRPVGPVVPAPLATSHLALTPATLAPELPPPTPQPSARTAGPSGPRSRPEPPATPAASTQAAPAVPRSLARAVARIPGRRAESARWVSRSYAGHWGATDWYANTIYISPRTPRSRLYSVVVHEWSHLLQVRAYGGDVHAAMTAMNRHFDGRGMVGAERAADCMTLLQGGTWTNYTSCEDPRWRRAAARLLRGLPL